MSEQKIDAERAAFEAYMLGREHPVIGWIDGHWFGGGDDPATYANDYVQGCWVMWQARSLPVGVPDGWALVPTDPAKCLDMGWAYLDAARDNDSSRDWAFSHAGYRAMLAAAPAAPTVKAEQPECGCCGQSWRCDDDCDTRQAPSLPAAGSSDLTAVRCQCCATEYPHDSYDAGFIAGSGMCQVCDAAMPPKDLPATGSTVEEVDLFSEWFGREVWTDGCYGNPDILRRQLWPCWQARAALSAQQSARQPELTVWEGPMPESNGKSNFTAVLMRKGANLFDGIAGGMTIARSEYPDRVRYEADCVRWLIGELDNEPCIIDYDTDKHSGYVAQQSAPERVSVPSLADVDRYRIELLPERDAGYVAKAYVEESEPVAEASGFTAVEAVREVIALLASHQRGEA